MCIICKLIWFRANYLLLSLKMLKPLNRIWRIYAVLPEGKVQHHKNLFRSLSRLRNNYIEYFLLFSTDCCGNPYFIPTLLYLKDIVKGLVFQKGNFFLIDKKKVPLNQEDMIIAYVLQSWILYFWGSRINLISINVFFPIWYIETNTPNSWGY